VIANKEKDMPQKTYAGITVDVDAEGYLTSRSQWTRDVAEAIAREEGLDVLSPLHWKVIEFMQNDARETGQAPTVRKITKAGVVTTKELYDLFPGGPAKKAARIAGLPKPVGCV
jgi:tRNA 2-thiouridine synthesizing protein E